MNDELERALLDAGADVVGFADVGHILRPEIAHLTRAVSIGVCRNLNENTVRLLGALKRKAVLMLKKKGYRYLSIPADSDRVKDSFISRLYPLFPHKIAATSAGLGWIGRNGLLISPEYGPRLSLATVLTDAPLKAGRPEEKSRCRECMLCVQHCPSGAITGEEWSRSRPYGEFVQMHVCRSHKGRSRPVQGKPNCGLCITICPYGRQKFIKKDSRVRGVEDSSDKKLTGYAINE